jgi:hypothetical protein
MRLFERVAVACDHTPEMLAMAGALRAMLECFTLRVDFYHLIQKRQVLDFFARPPEADFTVLFTHGEEGRQLTFTVVDQEDADYEATHGWDGVEFALTPENIPEVVKGARGTLIAVGCGGGKPTLAEAFLAAGYSAFVGATTDYVNSDASLLFVVGLFYHLLAESQNYTPHGYTLEEAVARASEIDRDFEEGTRAFRCWRRGDIEDTEKEAGC